MSDSSTESDLLRKWPNYLEWLDESRLRTAMSPTLAQAVRRESPFPYLFVHPFFPEQFYGLLEAAWPPLDAFRSGQGGRKLDLEPREGVAAETSRSYGALPQPIRDVWNFMTQVVNRRIVGPWLAEVFRQEIDERVRLVQSLCATRGLIIEAAGLSTGSFMSNAGRLMMRGPGYKLRAHVDPLHYLVTVLHYFPVGSEGTTGTLLFEAERPISSEVFVTGGSKHFHEHGIAVKEVDRMPFAANSLTAFPNLLHAAHGAPGPLEGYRRVYQYHLSFRDDTEPL